VSDEADVVWLDAPGVVVLRSEPVGELREGEVLCDTIVSAISPGTEIAAYQGLPPLRPSVGYPRLQGYCNVARVVSSQAQDLAPGDRVLSFMSHRSRFRLPSGDVLFKLPEDADARATACAYLYHLGYNAVLRSGVRAGSRVLVIGLGVLGLTSIAMARVAGADVFAVTNQLQPAAIASSLGARVFDRSGRAALAEALGTGADVVISTVNGWEDWRLALEMAAQNGVIACLGFPGRGEALPAFNPFDSQYFYMKQLRIEAVGASPETNDSRGFLRFNERENIRWIASLIAAGRLDPRQLISGIYPGREIARAYEDLAARKGAPLTYLLDWSARA
jgi:threonine dehydrogenase-like Zn-dependent dehydrogenase